MAALQVGAVEAGVLELKLIIDSMFFVLRSSMSF